MILSCKLVLAITDIATRPVPCGFNIDNIKKCECLGEIVCNAWNKIVLQYVAPRKRHLRSLLDTSLRRKSGSICEHNEVT